jgi:hypothetical protein
MPSAQEHGLLPVRHARNDDGRHPLSRVEAVLVGALAVASVALAVHLLHESFIGHDDGVYAAAGMALAHDGRYALANLPAEPPQTKYPPLYPALLSPVWALFPDAPENIRALKTVNAFLLGPAAILFWLLLRRVHGATSPERLLGAAAFISLPGVFAFTDLLTTEMAFLGLLLALLLVLPREEGTSPRRAMALGGLCALLVLTRMTGVAVVGGVLVYLLTWRERRAASIVAATVALLTAPWFIWRALAIPSVILELQAFYLQYESSAWQALISNPGFAARVIASNAVFYSRNAYIPFGLHTLPLAASIVAVAVMGLRRCSPRQRWSWGAIAACYAALVVGHPMAMERYLVPLIPLVMVVVVAGTAAVRTWLTGRTAAAQVLAMLPIAALLAGNLAWLQHYASTREEGPQWHFGRRIAFDWRGFEETFAWIRSETPASAVLACGLDPVYFMHTGRRAIRPWVHRPELYVASYGRPTEAVDEAAAIQAQLDALGVTYLIVDPTGADGESDHARRTLAALLDGPWWELTFVSRKGVHRVYGRRGGS